ncbi:MAG: beta-lactamase family protein [Brevinematales bacterium]|nr:beta-lactamase family protein [Brevinematales bacterium]
MLLHEILDNHIARFNTVPGAGIFYFDSEGYSTAFAGKKHIRQVEKITSNTLFEAASLTKPLFAYIVILMIDKGILSLDTPIDFYIKKYKIPILDYQEFLSDPAFLKITPRAILIHSTGLPNWMNIKDYKELLFDPGDYFQYSGMSYVFLQWLIERITSQSIQELAMKYVFRPLVLKQSGFEWRMEWENDLANGHSSDGEPLEKQRKIQGGAAAALLTTVRDYGFFFRDFVDKIRKKEDVFAQVDIPQIRRFRNSDFYSQHSSIAWGLGIGMELYDDEWWIWQVGANPNFFNWALANPSTGQGAVIFTNSEPGNPVPEAVLSALFGDGHPCFEFDKVYLSQNS